MTTDRGDRPSLLVERFRLHIFSRVSMVRGSVELTACDTISIGGTALSVAEPPCHPSTQVGTFSEQVWDFQKKRGHLHHQAR